MIKPIRKQGRTQVVEGIVYKVKCLDFPSFFEGRQVCSIAKVIGGIGSRFTKKLSAKHAFGRALMHHFDSHNIMCHK